MPIVIGGLTIIGVVKRQKKILNTTQSALSDRDLIKVEFSRRKRLPEKLADMFSHLRNQRSREARELESPLLM